LVDERLTTAAATTALRGAGLSSRSSRAVVDQVAAAALLQGVLDALRASGRWPGQVVAADPPPAPHETRGA
jgi:putative Holliday junction resolvase